MAIKCKVESEVKLGPDPFLSYTIEKELAK